MSLYLIWEFIWIINLFIIIISSCANWLLCNSWTLHFGPSIVLKHDAVVSLLRQAQVPINNYYLPISNDAPHP